MFFMNEELGIGIDIESINRFHGLEQAKDALFFEKIYTPDELAYCFSKTNPAPHLAVRFAAKEAVVKALYSLGREAIPFSAIEISHNLQGLPLIKINHKEHVQLQSKISLSHCQDKAVAFALLKRVENK